MPDHIAAPAYHFHAFLSYSHADRTWADWLHRGLERYRVPAALLAQEASWGGAVPRRLFPIFRDREELPTSSDLGQQIESALRASRFLIVVCSPRAAASIWVNEEVRNFKRLGGEARVLCVIVDGEPNASDGKAGWRLEDECFPPAARYRVGAEGTLLDERTEPIAADARAQGDGRANALLKLAAGLLGVGYDELKRRDEVEQRRRLRRTQMLAVLFAFLTVAAAWAGLAAMHQSGIAEQRRVEAEEEREAAVEQRNAAVHQRWLANSQKKVAEQKTRETLEALSRADFEYGSELIERGNSSDGTAYLARALRHDAGNLAASQRLYSLLAYRTYQLPEMPPLPAPGGIRAWDYSPDGKTLLLHSIRGGFQLFDSATGQPRSGRLSLGGYDTQEAQFRRDGELVLLKDVFQLATSTSEHLVVRWDLASDRPVGPVIHTGLVSNYLRLSFDRRTDLAVIQEFGGHTLHLWKMETGQPAGPPLNVHDEISGFWLLPNGALAFVVEKRKKLTVFEVATGAIKAEVVAPEDVEFHDYVFGELGAFSLKTTPNKNNKRMWRLADAVTDEQAGYYLDEDFRLLDARLDPLGLTMLGYGRDGQLHRAGIRGIGARLSEPIPHRAIAFPISRPDQRQMVTEYPADSAQLWTIPPSVPGGRILLQTRGAARAALSPDGRWLLTAGHEAGMRLFDAAVGEATPRQLSVENALVEMAFSADSAWAAVAELQGKVAVFSTVRPEEEAWRFEPGGTLPRVQFSPDGRLLLVVSQGNRLGLWNRETRRRIGESAELGLSAGFGFLANGEECYMARGKEIVIFRAADLTERQRIRAAPGLASLEAAALSSDGELIAASCPDAGIGVWRVADGQPAGARIELKERLRSLAFFPDGRTLLARLDNELRFFDLETGRESAPSLHLLGLGSASVSFDGRLVLTTAQRSARLWDWRTGRPITDAMAVTFDASLTPDGRSLLRDQYSACQLVPLPPTEPAPAWLPELAECVTLRQLRADAIFQPLPAAAWLDLRPRLAALPDGDAWSEFGRWFASDPWERPLTPGSATSTREFLEKQLPEFQAILRESTGK